MDHRERAALARAAARAGATVAERHFRGGLPVETKDGPTDVVTRADREAQAAVLETLQEGAGDEPVLAEESTGGCQAVDADEVPSSGPAWVVDPIDGTNNYVRGLRTWGTSVAAVVDGAAVGGATVCPVLDDAYVAGPTGVRRNGAPVTVSDRSDPETCTVAPTIWWDFDRRDEYAAAAAAIVTRFGDMVRLRCAQATLAEVAAGGLDGALTNVDVNPWDTVAGAFMVERAGGRVTDLAGDPWGPASTGLVASNGRCHGAMLAAARDIVKRAAD